MMSEISQISQMVFDDGTIFTYIGFAAGIATIMAFAIQTIRILSTKNITGLSSYMYTMYSLALICWFTYGIYIESWILAFSNLITFFFTFSILLMILYYDEEDKIERYRRDPLTYVFNKKYYEDTVPSKIIAAQIAQKPFCILVATINNLSQIQDKLGSKYRDRALKHTAKALEKALRDSDFIARIDNNKFAIFLDNVNASIAKSVTLRVIESIHNVVIKKSDKLILHPELLVGICPSTEGTELAVLTAKAETALSRTSYNQQNMIKIYSAEKSKAAATPKPQPKKTTAKASAPHPKAPKAPTTKNKKIAKENRS